MYKYFVLIVAICLVTSFATGSTSADPGTQTLSRLPVSIEDGPMGNSSFANVLQQGTSGPVIPFGAQIIADINDPQVKALARDAGIRWFYTYVKWSEIEPSEGNFQWPYDSFFAGLSAAGFTPLVGIGGTPRDVLLNPAKGGGPIQQTAYQRFGNFLRTLVAHYSQPPYNVHYWAINFGNFELDQYPDAWGCYWKEYADILKIAAPAIHETDPNGKLVIGALAYDWFDTSTYTVISNQSQCLSRSDAWFNLFFFNGVIDSGGAPYIDIINFNYYSRMGGLPPQPHWTTIVGKAQALLDKLPADQRNKQFFISEIGEPFWSKQTYTPPISDESATRLIAQSYTQILGAVDSGIHVVGALWFTLGYFEEWPSNLMRIWGMLNADLSKRQEYYAYQTMTRELADAVYQAKYTSTPGVEGYNFTLPDGATKTVLWNTPWHTNVFKSVSFPGSVRVVDWLGNPVSTIQVGGQTQFQVNGRPVYVGPAPLCVDFTSPVGVDNGDLMAAANQWRAPVTPQNAKFDLDKDTKISVADLMLIASRYGLRNCPVL